jgi:hypothetical protein
MKAEIGRYFQVRLWTLSQEKRAGAGWMTTSSVASKKTSAKTNSQRDFALAA